MISPVAGSCGHASGTCRHIGGRSFSSYATVSF